MAIRKEGQGRFDFGLAGPSRPRNPERLFFALMPDAEAAARLHRFGEAFAAARGLTGRRLAPERLHLSLHHVGDFPRLRPKFLFAAARAAGAVTVRPFPVILGAIATFELSRRSGPSAQALVLLGGDAPLLDFHRRLGAAMQENGLRPSPRIAPHVTLSYGSERVPPVPVEAMGWTAASFALVHSERGFGRYNVLGRWTVGGEPIAVSALAG